MPKRATFQVGQRYGRLVITGDAPRAPHGQTQVQCLCDCGTVVVKVLHKMMSGHTRSCGCLRGVSHGVTSETSMLGQRFGRLTVTGRNRNNTREGGTQWDCLCDCGHPTTVPLNRLRTGITRSCGCLHHDNAVSMGKSNKGKRAHNWKGVGEISGCFWKQILAGAEQRGLSVTVTHQEIWQLYQRQNGRCALTGFALTFDRIGVRSSGNASLDRIDSTKGYEIDNIQWVEKRVQQMKWDMAQAELVFLCKAVVTHSARRD